MFGISDGYYQSHENTVLFGTGQGSGALQHLQQHGSLGQHCSPVMESHLYKNL
jgi:hypothetical protein